MKKQLQKKAEEFCQRFYSICEEFFKEAEVTRERSLSTWTQQRMEAVSHCFIMLIQIEMDRFLQTCCLLHEYHYKKSSSPLKDKLSDGSNFPSPRSKQGKNLPTLPGWLPSIADALPELHQVLQQKILMADAIMKATLESQSANPNQTVAGHKSASKSSKDAIEVTAKTKTFGNEKDDLLAKVLHDETQLLLLRFERLVSKACSHVSDLEALLEGANTQMEKWIQDSREAKMEATEQVVDIVQEAIEESIPLWYYICLDGDGFVIDETKLQLDPPRALGLHPLPNLAIYHFQVLEELAKLFKAVCPKGYVSLMNATEAVRNTVQSVHFTCKNDLTLSLIPRVPGTKSRPGGPFEVWKDYTGEIIRISSAGETQVIDWRCFLVSLIDAHYHNFISLASVDDILDAHHALKEAANGCSSFIDLPQILGAKLWFDSGNGNESGEFMRRIFFSMLSSENGMPWQSLLLYLCKDSDTERALRKAHAAIMGVQSESVSLTSQELLQAVYPCGTEGALDKGCQIWSFHDVQKLAEKLQAKVDQEAEVYESTNRMEELEDNLTGSDAFYVRSTGACMGSKLSEQSLVSFQLNELDEGGRVSGGITSSISSEAVASMNNDENRASKEASNEKRTSNIDSYQMDNNKERQDDCDTAGAQLEVCSLFSEQAVATINEFLVACNTALQGSRDMEKEAAVSHKGEGVGEVGFSLQGLLASELFPTLQARFGVNTLLAMAPTSLAST